MHGWPRLPYGTKTLPGCGGEIRRQPEDFRVEEIALYEPSGHGEHLYVNVEKRGLSTPALVERICEAFSLHRSQVGHAGLKDARSVSRQWLSLHTPDEPRWDELEAGGLRILAVSRHGNKLRPGHLRGNRFEIKVRGACPPENFARLAAEIAGGGFPNYFGPQRVGEHGSTAREGRRLVRGGFARRIPRHKARFLTNAYQSELFNRVVAMRLEAVGGLGEILAGDLAVPTGSAGFFSVTGEQLDAARARAAQGEISPSAPLFGYKIPLAQGTPGEWEREVLREEGMTLERFKGPRKGLAPKGERRAARAFAGDLRWSLAPQDGATVVTLSFTLGPGVYATSLLRELMKTQDSPAPGAPRAEPLKPPESHAP